MARGDLEGLVRELLKLLVGGSLAFMVLAIGQEWDFFASAWFGSGEGGAEVAEADVREARETVRELLTLMGHLYASGGDRRFAERMPASEAVVGEMIEDIRYLGRRHRVQEPRLSGIEFTAVEPLGGEELEVRTRERWTIRVVTARDGREAGPPRTQSFAAKYRLSRGGRGWKVEAWELAEP